MPGKRIKYLFTIITLFILGSACNISQVVVRETVVVTATSQEDEVNAELTQTAVAGSATANSLTASAPDKALTQGAIEATNNFVGTAIGGTIAAKTLEAARPTQTPTKPPPPQPTLPQLVVEAIPGQLKARLLHPDYFPAKTDLNFRVEAYDPEVGNKDGAGIKTVEFHILDNNGNEVLKQVEQNAPYCSFGGDSPCPVWVFRQQGNKWPSGQPIQNGTYTLQINIHAQNSDKDENFDTQFDIQIGQ